MLFRSDARCQSWRAASRACPASGCLFGSCGHWTPLDWVALFPAVAAAARGGWRCWLLLVLLPLLLLVLLLLLLVLLLLLLVLLLLLLLWWMSRWLLLWLLVLGLLRALQSLGPLNLGIHKAGTGVYISVGRRGIGPNRIRGLRPRDILSTSDLGIGSRGCGLYRWAHPRWTWSSSVGSPGRRRRRQR